MATGSVEGDSLVRSIVVSTTFFFPGVVLGLISHSIHVDCDLCRPDDGSLGFHIFLSLCSSCLDLLDCAPYFLYLLLLFLGFLHGLFHPCPIDKL
jgi:hypothetical protein